MAATREQHSEIIDGYNRIFRRSLKRFQGETTTRHEQHRLGAYK
jgi:hypothetical protein